MYIESNLVGEKTGASLIYPMRIWLRVKSNLCDSRVNFLYIMFILLFALSHDVLPHLGEVIYPVISSSQVGGFFLVHFSGCAVMVESQMWFPSLAVTAPGIQRSRRKVGSEWFVIFLLPEHCRKDC